MKKLQNKWESLWKSHVGQQLSGGCLNLPFFGEHLANSSNSVCDVGCGDISYMNSIADILIKEFNRFENPTNSFKYYVGIDFSREALKLAKKNAKWHDIKHKTDFVQADLRFLPLRNNSFESVICVETLQMLGEDYKKGLDEIDRIADKKIYLSATQLTPYYKIEKSIEGGWIVRVRDNPYPVFVSKEQDFKNILSEYGSVKGTDYHPCPSIISCFPHRLLFKIEK
jgi:SAM-dependent methyltransferase